MSNAVAKPTQTMADVFARAGALNLPFQEDAFSPTYGGGMQIPLLKKGGNAWNVTQPDNAPDVKVGGRLNRVSAVFVHASNVPGRAYYADAFKPGVSVPPTCWSADGIAPAPSAEVPQADACAKCPQAVLNGKSYPCGKRHNYLLFVLDAKYTGFAKMQFGGGDYTRPLVDSDLRDEGFMNPVDFMRKMVQSRLALAAVQVEMAFDSGDGKISGHPCKPLIRVVDTTPADVLEVLNELTEEEKRAAVAVRYAVRKNENAEALPPQAAAPKRSVPRAAPAVVEAEVVEEDSEPVREAPVSRTPARAVAPPPPAAKPAPKAVAAPAPAAGGNPVQDRMAALRARMAGGKAAPAATQHAEEHDDV
jgi:hypothetical protein